MKVVIKLGNSFSQTSGFVVVVKTVKCKRDISQRTCLFYVFLINLLIIKHLVY